MHFGDRHLSGFRVYQARATLAVAPIGASRALKTSSTRSATTNAFFLTMKLERVVGVLPPILWRNDGKHVPMLRNLAVFDSKKIVVRSGLFRACLD